jgi:dynactin complex subunit
MSDGQSIAEVEAELERMRAKVAELQSQLEVEKQQNSQDPGTLNSDNSFCSSLNSSSNCESKS